jgi:hypothetical protein
VLVDLRRHSQCDRLHGNPPCGQNYHTMLKRSMQPRYCQKNQDTL